MKRDCLWPSIFCNAGPRSWSTIASWSWSANREEPVSLTTVGRRAFDTLVNHAVGARNSCGASHLRKTINPAACSHCNLTRQVPQLPHDPRHRPVAPRPQAGESLINTARTWSTSKQCLLLEKPEGLPAQPLTAFVNSDRPAWWGIGSSTWSRLAATSRHSVHWRQHRIINRKAPRDFGRPIRRASGRQRDALTRSQTCPA